MKVLLFDVLIIVFIRLWYSFWDKIGKWYDKKYPDKKEIAGNLYPGMKGTGYSMTHGELYSFLGFVITFLILVFVLNGILKSTRIVELLPVKF